MAKRRSTNYKRCPECRINKRWCFCDSLIGLKNKTPLTVIMHKAETKLPSNTSTLALRMLQDARLLLRGVKDLPFYFEPREGHQPLYLFPSEDAHPLTKEYVQKIERPIQLIVPDSTWRIAKKFHKREPSLGAIPRVKMTDNLEGIYTLRKSPVEGGVCTLEAIAKALEIIEGPHISRPLLDALRVMNDRIEMSRDPKLWVNEEK